LKCLLFLIETLLDQVCQHITVAGTDRWQTQKHLIQKRQALMFGF